MSDSDRPTKQMIEASKRLKKDHKKLEKKTQNYYANKIKQQRRITCKK